MEGISAVFKRNLDHSSKCFKRNEIIVLQGEGASDIFIIDGGWVKVLKYSTEGKESIVDLCGPGYSVGLPNLFQNDQFEISAVAMERTEVSIFEKKDVEKFLIKNPEVMSLVVAALGRKVLTVKELSVISGHEEAIHKIKNFLDHLARTYGVLENLEFKIPFKISQETIAQILGLSRTRVNACLKVLEDAGYISYQDNNHLSLFSNKVH